MNQAELFVCTVVRHLPATLSSGLVHSAQFILEVLGPLMTDLVVLVIEAYSSDSVLDGVVDAGLDLDA